MLHYRKINGIKFRYNTETGEVCRWRARRQLWVSTGYGLDSWGYCRIRFENKQYSTHRFIFLIMTGKWPIGMIDHINGNKADNSWANLRDTSNQDNQLNQHPGSWTGEKHITKRGSRFRVRFGGLKHLGYYNTLDEAIEARDNYLKVP